MSLFERVKSLSDTLIFRQRPPCRVCIDEGRGEIPMEPSQVYDFNLCAWIDAWECPECERKVMRGDSPRMVNADGDVL